LAGLNVKKALIILPLVALGLAALAYFVSQSSANAAEDAYTFDRVQYGRIQDLVNSVGPLQPRDVLTISSTIPGQVTAIAHDVNKEVEEGRVLIQLDDRQATQKLAEAEAAYKQAEAAVRVAEASTGEAESARDLAKLIRRRVQNLPDHQKSPIDDEKADLEVRRWEATLAKAKANVDLARGALKQAEAKRAEAKLGLELTTIRVPVVRDSDEQSKQPGIGEIHPNDTERPLKRKYVILDRKVNLNEMVGPTRTTPLFILAGDLAKMQAHVQIAEADLSRVAKGMKAEFTVSAYSDAEDKFDAAVSDVRQLPVTDRGAIFYKVVLDLQNVRDKKTGEWLLRPGMTASMDIIRRTKRDAWKMPSSAISFQLDEYYLNHNQAAKDKLSRWQERPDRDDWRPVWILRDKKPWPIFVRIKQKNEAGIRDARYYEVLEWDPDEPAPDAKSVASFPEVIIGAPAVEKGGLFKLPNIKF
jgi:HlyD family secretion protein